MESDRTIQQRVRQRLERQQGVDAAEVGVAVHDRVVTLTGMVPTYGAKHRAEVAALRVRGVRAVANDLTVKLSPTHERTDAEIANAVLDALDRDQGVPRGRLAVSVSHSVVTLTGTVMLEFQRRAAMQAVRDVQGVRGVCSAIRIESHPTVRAVRDRITTALHRSVQVEADRMTVEVEGGRVILGGTVASQAERQDVERAVWAVPGVTAVSDRLRVEYPEAIIP